MKLGATARRELRTLEAEIYFADGAYGDTGWSVYTVAGHKCAGPYHVPAAHVDVYGVYPNSLPVGAYRGYGHPEGQFMMGRLMDMLARRLDMPLPELMRRNFVGKGKKNFLGQTIRAHHGDLPACLDADDGAALRRWTGVPPALSPRVSSALACSVSRLRNSSEVALDAQRKMG